MSQPTGSPSGIPGLSEVLRKAQDQLGRSEKIRSELAGLTGCAQSPDGYIRVTCTAEDPVAELEIDPQAMRYYADELAAVLQQVIRDAKADLAHRTEEVLREQMGDDGPMALVYNPEAAQAKLRQLSEMVQAGSRDLNQLFERIRQQMPR